MADAEMTEAGTDDGAGTPCPGTDYSYRRQAIADVEGVLVSSRPSGGVDGSIEVTSPRQAAERHNTRGRELLARNETAAAAAEYTAAIRLWPGFDHAHNNRGAARMAAGDRAGAFADYDRALELNPELAEAYNNRGIARFLGGDMSGALADLQTAIRLNPAFAAAFDNCAAVHNKKWEHAKAVASYTKAIELYSPDPRSNGRRCTLYALRSFSLYHLHQQDAAMADLRESYRLDRDLCAFTVTQALERDAKSKYDFTVTNCEEYLLADPTDIFSIVRRGLTNLVAGRLAEFQADYDAAVRIPSHDDLAMGLFFLKTLQDRIVPSPP